MTHAACTEIDLPDARATTAFGTRLARVLRPGTTVLLEGPLGAGKSHLARAAIQALAGPGIDVPSPTYTLVQTYDTLRGDLWHADLYRLTDPIEVEELGLVEAMEEAIVLVEWPDRLGALRPKGALTLALAYADPGRRLRMSCDDGALLHELCPDAG